MDENCFTKTDEDEIFFYAYDLQDVIAKLYNIINDFFEKFKDYLSEQAYSLFQEFLSNVYNFRNRHKPKRTSLLVILPLYRWVILRLKAMPLTQPYDGISKMLRRIYLRHHQRTTSVADDSAICGIA